MHCYLSLPPSPLPLSLSLTQHTHTRTHTHAHTHWGSLSYDQMELKVMAYIKSGIWLILCLSGQYCFTWYLWFHALHTLFTLGVFLFNFWLRGWVWWALFLLLMVSFSELLYFSSRLIIVDLSFPTNMLILKCELWACGNTLFTKTITPFIVLIYWRMQFFLHCLIYLMKSLHPWKYFCVHYISCPTYLWLHFSVCTWIEVSVKLKQSDVSTYLKMDLVLQLILLLSGETLWTSWIISYSQMLQCPGWVNFIYTFWQKTCKIVFFFKFNISM